MAAADSAKRGFFASGISEKRFYNAFHSFLTCLKDMKIEMPKLSKEDLILALLEWNGDDGSILFFTLDSEQLSYCILSCHLHSLHSARR